MEGRGGLTGDDTGDGVVTNLLGRRGRLVAGRGGLTGEDTGEGVVTILLLLCWLQAG